MQPAMSDRAAPASLSYTAVWEDTVRMLRANAGLLVAIAGAFLFLPSLIVERYFPQPTGAADLAFPEYVQMMSDYMRGAWAPLLLATLLNMIGLAAIYLLLLAVPRMTVGGAVARALPILPFFYLLTLVLNLAVGIGLLLLIVPGVYLLGRLVLASPILVIETPRAPLSAFRRSWRMTMGRGWTIALLVVVVYLVGALVSFAVEAGLGSILLLLLGSQGVGGLLAALLSALVGAAFSVVAAVLIAAIYRSITSRVENARAI